jgi:TolA-binding protein
VDKDRYEKTIADLSEQVEKAKQEHSASQTAARQAAEVYRMMTQLPGEQRLQGVDAFAKMDANKLSFLERQALKDKAEALRVEIGQTAFERGKQAFRRNDMNTAATELTRFLAMNPSPSDAMDASFFLGTAFNNLRQHEKAVPLLSNFVANDKRSKSRDYAMLLLAGSLEQTGQLQKAADVAREALGTYPNSDFTGQLKARLSSVKHAMNGGNDATVPAAGTQGAAAVPAVAPKAAPATVPAAAPAQAPSGH